MFIGIIPFYIIAIANYLNISIMYAALRNKSIYLYRPKQGGTGAKSVSDKSKQNLRLKYTAGGLSNTAKNDIRRIVQNWQWAVLASQKLWSKGRERRRRYLVLITLTLPAKQTDTDNEIKRRYLNVWLQNLERVHKGINWLWVAECQQNGNIHFHVIVDRYVQFEWIRRTWNRVMGNGDYIKRFKAKFGEKQAPSVNVKGQNDMHNPARYITKYLTGDKYVRDIQGRKWGCCDRLRSIDRAAFVCGNRIDEYVVGDFERDLKGVKIGDYTTAYYFKTPLIRSGLYDTLLCYCRNDVCKLFAHLYPELADCMLPDLPTPACEDEGAAHIA